MIADKSRYTLNGYELDYRNTFFNKGSAFINLKNNYGLHLSIIGNGYWYDVPNNSITKNNPDFYIWNNNMNYCNIKISILSGLGYKIQYKRLMVIPYLELGMIILSESSFENILLKEIGANNIRQITNSLKSKSSFFDYSLGVDLYYFMGRYWGVFFSIFFDTYNPVVESSIEYTDYYSNQTFTDKLKFNHKNVLISIGGFVTIFRSKVQEE